MPLLFPVRNRLFFMVIYYQFCLLLSTTNSYNF
nr:MAG TPA: hypothetical protein [Caudoviricetes sp.]